MKNKKGFPYRTSKKLPWTTVNALETYVVVIKSTGEVLETFRTKCAAQASLKRFRKLACEEVEVREK